MKRIILNIITIIFTMLITTQYAAAQSFNNPADNFPVQEGLASWYGPGFEGRPTASGEIFDSSQLTAAHPTLPFGTHLMVTNRENNRQVVVRVNDRGPFVPDRIIDVSRAAAERLDMISRGVAQVYIEVMRSGGWMQPPAENLPPSVQTQRPVSPPQVTEPVAQVQEHAASERPITIIIYPPSHTEQQPVQQQTTIVPPPPPPPPPKKEIEVVHIPIIPPVVEPIIRPPEPISQSMQEILRAFPQNPVSNRVFRIQVGSYKVAKNAVDAYAILQRAGFAPEYERHSDFYRVVLRHVREAEIRSVLERIDRAGFHNPIIRVE